MQAWWIAHLPGNTSVKLDHLLSGRTNKPKKAQSWEDEFAAFEAWARA